MSALPPNRFFCHPDSGWSRNQPQPAAGTFFQRRGEAEKREPGNEVAVVVALNSLFPQAEKNYCCHSSEPEGSQQGSKPNLGGYYVFRSLPTMPLDFQPQCSLIFNHNFLHAHCPYIPTAHRYTRAVSFLELLSLRLVKLLSFIVSLSRNFRLCYVAFVIKHLSSKRLLANVYVFQCKVCIIIYCSTHVHCNPQGISKSNNWKNERLSFIIHKFLLYFPLFQLLLF